MYEFSLLNPKGGSCAEYIVIKADNVSLIPGNLTTEQAGVMPVDAMTALRGLDDTLNLKPGESVMIFGASGGIGHLAVQLAKRMGATVFAVASGDDGVALARRLGADAVVDGHKDDVAAAARQFAPDGFDAALLTAGGKAAEKALFGGARGGRIAYPNGVEPEPQARAGVTIRGYDGMPDPTGDREAQPPDRVRPVPRTRRRRVPVGANRRRSPCPRRPLPRQAHSAAKLTKGDISAGRDCVEPVAHGVRCQVSVPGTTMRTGPGSLRPSKLMASLRSPP